MAAKVVRLWWRCSLCRWRFDTFGVDHDADDQRAAATDLAQHLEACHGRRLDTWSEVETYLRPAGKTSRVVRRSVIIAR